MMGVQMGHHKVRTIGRECVLAGLMVFLALASGCATVKPWQGEVLADPIMQPGRNPIAAGQLDHIYFSREAASGGTTVGGGGCGCN
jgi:hypothetical protein